MFISQLYIEKRELQKLRFVTLIDDVVVVVLFLVVVDVVLVVGGGVCVRHRGC